MRIFTVFLFIMFLTFYSNGIHADELANMQVRLDAVLTKFVDMQTDLRVMEKAIKSLGKRDVKIVKLIGKKNTEMIRFVYKKNMSIIETIEKLHE